MTTRLKSEIANYERPGSRATGTAESDENYDLVSVFYHCLKAADACTQYIADAEDAGDQELIDFFERARAVQNELAAEARELLRERLLGTSTMNDEEN